MSSFASSGISSGFSSIFSFGAETSSGFSTRESSFFFETLTFSSFEEVFAFFFGFFSLLVSVYTLILVFLQFLCFGVRLTLPSVLATTHEGTGWACLSAWERCFFFPEGLWRAMAKLSES
jgi:hypothetical protein